MLKHPGERNSIQYFPSSSIILYTLEKETGEFLIYLAKRRHDLKFFPGLYSGIGGKIEKSDYTFAEKIKNNNKLSGSLDDISYIVCAWRELLEEVGIFFYESENKELKQQVLNYVLSRKSINLNELFDKFHLDIDNIHFDYFKNAGFRYTPEFTNKIFKTRFYLLYLDNEIYKPLIRDSNHEFINGLWDKPENFFLKFKQNKFLTSPPVLGVIRELSNYPHLKKLGDLVLPYNALEVLNSNDDLPIGLQVVIEPHSGIQIIPFKSLTRPPATTTNLIIIGNEKKIIIDPGTHIPQERKRLDLLLNSFKVNGSEVIYQLITHHHRDHWQSAVYIRDKYDIPIAINPHINDYLDEREILPVDLNLKDHQIINLGIDNYNQIDWNIRIKFLPGHTNDHVGLIDERFQVLIAGDLVAGIGTVIIDNLEKYYESLNYLDNENISMIFPGHGPVVTKGEELIKTYIQHRTLRGKQILATINAGLGKTIREITSEVYKEIPKSFIVIAEKQVNVYMKYFEDKNMVKFNPSNSKWVQLK